MTYGNETTNRTWCFENAEFDEARRELRVGGQLLQVEARPLQLLRELLLRGGEVATRDELLQAVWGRETVPQSLTTAIAKLRTAFGAQGRTVIEAVHGIGYKIGVPVEVRAAPEKPRLAFTLRTGDPVPNRPQWRLDHAFGTGQNKDVWLARHVKTDEKRVFKFADTEQRLDALKREAALSRILHQALGERPDLVRVSEWNFETRPYFIESIYGGPNLAEWAQSRGGLTTIPLADRIALVASIARTLAAAHGVGVLHRDIKPTNILVAEGESGPVLRLVDFGSGRLTEAARLEAVTVTGLGLTAGAPAEGERISGTLRYMAPEVQRGGPPTIVADVYALGILLYQVVVGDLDRPLVAGWQNDIVDRLLREDIADAASGDPSRRLSSAAILVERLESLDTRKIELERIESLQTEASRLAYQVERASLRRPWVIMTVASLALGFVATGISAVRATRARDEARHQTDITKQVNNFLTDDLLGRGDPASSGNVNETLMEAAEKAEPRIAQRFSREPLIAASIYASLAQAFAGRNTYAQARDAYDRAAAAYGQAEGAGSADTTILRLQQVQMEIAASQLARAEQLIEDVRPNVDHLGLRTPEAHVWLLAAQAMTQLFGGDMQAAQRGFKAAGDLADTMPDVIDEESRFWFRQREAFSYNRLGQWDKATTLLNSLLIQQNLLHGPRHPDTLVVKELQGMVLMSSGQSLLAIAKVDEIMDDLIKVYGPDHRFTLQAYGTRAEAEGLIERNDDGIRDDTILYKASLAKQGPHAIFTFGALSDIATLECRSGRADRGLSHATEALDDARATFNDTNALTQAISSATAFCLIMNGRYDDAANRLSGIDQKGIAQVTSDPDTAAFISLMRAAIASGRGDRNTAKQLLREPLQSYSRPNSDRYLSRWTTTLNKSLSASDSR